MKNKAGRSEYKIKIFQSGNRVRMRSRQKFKIVRRTEARMDSCYSFHHTLETSPRIFSTFPNNLRLGLLQRLKPLKLLKTKTMDEQFRNQTLVLL